MIEASLTDSGRGPSPGSVVLVGAGPGDPGLLTRRGAECLARADAVVYDHLVHPRLLDLAPPSAERIFAGKRAGKCAMQQHEINVLLAELAAAGKRVVRLKGGDPFVFGRGAEEAEYLAERGVPFRVVPGVTAAVGVSAYAGVPITHRDAASAVAFVTGHGDAGGAPSRVDWPGVARFPGTLVVYMGVGRLAEIRDALIAGGRAPSTPAALIHSGTLAGQRTVAATLVDLPEVVRAAGVGPPALVIVGEVVGRRESLAWFERLPLFGRTIVVTRPEGESDRSANDLEALGAEVLVAPTVAIRPVEDFGSLDGAIGRLSEFDWLVFTSGNGVRHFLDRLETLGRDLRALGHLRIATIGPSTAEAVRAYHLRADLVPESYRSEGLADALKLHARGARILLARADRGRTLLRDELSGIAHVEQVAVYRNLDAASIPASVIERIASGSVRWITLTSSAIAVRLHALLPDEARKRIGRDVRLASISPVTTEAARSLGWTVSAEAREFTWDGLISAILQFESRGDT